ncbi:class I SAM-dependent methyltransferase (plasmid) [Rhizobium leguminosarum]|uniref:class I SAM-dependent methyltransferase n=1 Tax=Rhizobium leguminosarum TaxID=384 RepID=UPI00103D9609|nr:class I SAM-dependent methyltransferase [Rhizobium leguminosarum]MBY5474033.1 methyltransferase domain-containing protein [Rhizobium leguminosarum]NKK95926.1 methyltransferase domain-containing protein [Rhizobium leguminosarum bv. viciae]TBZ39396.1 class I SAM-dependent methyltransferase [Rhizobium leguminosarum bv. viciae]TBZ61726.1 class I SAM-dependent methyltransferase [Rhizobium leguminosarum bv. viciae]TBZ75451.1 class I SAM-dependent methyltransferase [Rhizobium leguminosarum bv. vic
MREPDMQKLDALVGRLVGDVGAAMSGALVVLGDQVGIFKAMADGTPMSVQDLAAKTGIKERYLREWLSAQAAADYVAYDEKTDRFSLTPEQAMVFAEENSPAFFVGAFEVVQSMWMDEPKIADAFRTGKGLGWHEHSTCLFRGTERFFRPGYNSHLVNEWIPALAGVEAKLKAGASVADVGCGHGASTILMAQAYPASHFTGFDYHGPSIERAKAAAQDAGVADRVTFQQGSAAEFPGRGYDMVAMFDCLHDMGDPVGAGRHVKETLGPNGTWLIVEPFANDHLKDNLNPVGRVYYGASTMICTPASLSQEVGLGLGAQAGEIKLRKVALDAGFTHFRRATETPFNMVFEVRA